MRHGGFMNVLYIIGLISLLLDIYAYSGVKTWVSGWKSARRQKIALRTYLVFFVGVTGLFLVGITVTTHKYLTRFQEWVLSLFLTFLITKLFFIILLLLGDIVRFFWGLLRKLFKPKAVAEGPFFPSRRRFITEAGILLAAIPFTGFLYAI